MTSRLIQLTDLHLMSDPQAELKGICTRARLDKVLSFLNAQYPHPQRLIVTGDLTHDEQFETYQALRGILSPWLPCLRLLPGNHDDRTLMRKVFSDRILELEERNVFYDSVGEWRLFGLDSHSPGEVGGQLGTEQLTWLERNLTQHASQPTGLFLHHPPITVGSSWLDRIGLTDADELLRITRRHPQVRFLCCGHIHQDLLVADSTFVTFTTPSTAVQFRPETEALEVDSVAPGFRIIDLFPDGRYQTRIERVEV